MNKKVTIHEIYRVKLASKFIKKIPEARMILNLGSEYGNFHNLLKKNNSEVKILGLDLYGNPDIKVDLNKKINLPSECADIIMAGEVIEHLENPLNLIKESRRLLKVGGGLWLSTPNVTGLNSILHQNVTKDKDKFNRHIVGFTKEMLEYNLKKNKFKVINSFLIQDIWKRNIFYRIIVNVFNRLKPTIIIGAIKER